MKRIMIAAVLGLLMMSSVAEACCGKRIGCGSGCHRRQRVCFVCGEHRGLFHHCCQQQTTCQPPVAHQPAFKCQVTLVCLPALVCWPSEVYSTVTSPTVTYAAPQAVEQPQTPSKSTPQAQSVLPPIAIVPPKPPIVVAPPQPPAKSTPQAVPPPQPPGKTTPQRDDPGRNDLGKPDPGRNDPGRNDPGRDNPRR